MAIEAGAGGLGAGAFRGAHMASIGGGAFGAIEAGAGGLGTGSEAGAGSLGGGAFGAVEAGARSAVGIVEEEAALPPMTGCGGGCGGIGSSHSPSS